MPIQNQTSILDGHRPKFRFIVSISAIVLIWYSFSQFFPLGVSSPYATFQATLELLLDETALVKENLQASLYRIFIGFFISLGLSIVIGLGMGLSSRNEDYLYPIVLTGMMIPSLSWAMITLVVFGLTETAIIYAIVLTTTPFITVTIWEGVKDIEGDLFEVASMYDFSRYDRYRHVVGPQISPYIFSAARYGLGMCWKITVIVELLGASEGVGYQLNVAFSLFALDQVFGWTLILVAIMIFIEYGIIRTISRRVFGWREVGGGQQWR